MKKLLMLLLILLAGTIVSCRTIQTVEYLDPPVREILEKPETVTDLADMITYYEGLLSEWESWGISVYGEMPLPDSLQKIKDEESQNE